ncbi:GNAT family N-acetyltransferase [Actinophytocola xanthii]|nr:GNAT family N-acetyltransferase [Actinophytocola xanthii]
MIQVRRLTPDEWRLWREIRLAALADAPYAYGSTLEHEQAFDESVWRERLSAAGSMTAVALDGTEPAGAMAVFTPAGAAVPMLVAAWVHPAHRGRGVGDALVSDVLAWVRETGRDRIELRVADGNEPARRLFTRHGFVPTGDRERLESDPSVLTERLAWTAETDGEPRTRESEVERVPRS